MMLKELPIVAAILSASIHKAAHGSCAIGSQANHGPIAKADDASKCL